MDAATISSIISVIVLIGMVMVYASTRQIHGLVNSRLSLLKKAHDHALDKIDALYIAVEKLGGPKAPPIEERKEM